MSSVSGSLLTVERVPSGGRPNFISVLLGAAPIGVGLLTLAALGNPVGLIVGVVLGLLVGVSPQVAKH